MGEGSPLPEDVTDPWGSAQSGREQSYSWHKASYASIMKSYLSTNKRQHRDLTTTHYVGGMSPIL